MIPPDATAPPIRTRRPEVIVAPLVTFAVVGVLLFIARFVDRLPIQPPRCGFKSLTGIPCAGCGSSRAMMSLSRGEIAAALQYNPAITLSVVAIAVWLLWRTIRFLQGAPHSPRAYSRAKTATLITLFAMVFVANWIYLILFLP